MHCAFRLIKKINRVALSCNQWGIKINFKIVVLHIFGSLGDEIFWGFAGLRYNPMHKGSSATLPQRIHVPFM